MKYKLTTEIEVWAKNKEYPGFDQCENLQMAFNTIHRVIEAVFSPIYIIKDNEIYMRVRKK